jgi:hypothetical protein
MGGFQMAKTCSQCQAQASDDAAFCPSCGSTLAVTQGRPINVTTRPVAAGTDRAAAAHAYSFNAARWSTSDRVTGAATLVLLISLFLTWFSYQGIASESGLSAHGYLYLALFVSIAILLYLGARAGWDRLPIGVSLAHAPVVLTATILNVALVLLGFLLKPGGGAVSWSFGAWLSLVASVAAAAPIAIPAIQARRTIR